MLYLHLVLPCMYYTSWCASFPTIHVHVFDQSYLSCYLSKPLNNMGSSESRKKHIKKKKKCSHKGRQNWAKSKIKERSEQMIVFSSETVSFPQPVTSYMTISYPRLSKHLTTCDQAWSFNTACLTSAQVTITVDGCCAMPAMSQNLLPRALAAPSVAGDKALCPPVAMHVDTPLAPSPRSLWGGPISRPRRLAAAQPGRACTAARPTHHLLPWSALVTTGVRTIDFTV